MPQKPPCSMVSLPGKRRLSGSTDIPHVKSLFSKAQGKLVAGGGPPATPAVSVQPVTKGVQPCVQPLEYPMLVFLTLTSGVWNPLELLVGTYGGSRGNGVVTVLARRSCGLREANSRTLTIGQEVLGLPSQEMSKKGPHFSALLPTGWA